MRILHWLYRNTIASVPFGIATMILIAIYIAIGSGMSSVREWLEMDEILYFTWWPFKLLMIALVLNLAVVTVTRIPLTPPRYGVWCIHMGIILLVFSTGAYYSQKVEGLTLIPKDRTASHFYDRWERALYTRVEFRHGEMMALEGLPRFKRYDEDTGNADYLDRRSLRGLSPSVRDLDATTQQIVTVPLHVSLGAPDPIRLDVIGYYPYALVERVHRLTVMAEGLSRTFNVHRGQSISVPELGYDITVEDFQDDFPMFGTNEPVDAITLDLRRREPIEHETGPVHRFKRMVLAGRPVQTDFVPGIEGAGPMGQRQTRPVDANVIFELESDVGQRVFEVPSEARDRDSAMAGENQIIEVQISSGEWSRRVYLPFTLFVRDNVWPVAPIEIPGAEKPLSLAFGHLVRDMPMRITLNSFDAVPYAGAPASARSMMRDFVSHVTVTEPGTGRSWQDSARLNEPAFYSRSLGLPGVRESWIMYQAQWDPEGQRWTVLGIANRPAVRTMAVACVMIAFGLLYAFYAKPIIIRKMKDKALREAQARGTLKTDKTHANTM